jgi:catechol 2,3-dioxygenase-like lactoylglutathione lyase family enzyme
VTKKRIGEPWMPAPRYGRGLSGLSLNLLVRNIDTAVAFQTEVLGAQLVYHDPDVAVMRYGDVEWMLHAVHTYDAHPLHHALASAGSLGLGAELRLHGHDPDAAERAARERGFEVVQGSADKPHGLRECFIRDADGYVWVPDRPSERT